LGEHTKETLERGVFKRFIDSQPGFARLRWRYGSDGDRPDFVWPRGRIGVELGEWLHQEQTRRSVELDRYENTTSILCAAMTFSLLASAEPPERKQVASDPPSRPPIPAIASTESFSIRSMSSSECDFVLTDVDLSEVETYELK